MRTVFLLLVLVNVGFYAWAHYIAGPTWTSDPSPLARQIDPEKLRIVGAAEEARSPAPKPKPAPLAAPAPAPVAVPVPDKVTVPPAILACVRWGSFTLADAARAEKALIPLELGARLSRHEVEESANWWVFMPPQGSLRAAQRKARELRDLGIEEFFIIQDAGPQRWALSLGVFGSETAAREHLAALRERGVRTARVGQRELKVTKFWLQIERVDAVLNSRLKEIAPTFAGSELRDCT
jgi:hypothetical protein